MILEKKFKNVTIKYNEKDIKIGLKKILFLLFIFIILFISIFGIMYLTKNISRYCLVLFLPFIFLVYFLSLIMKTKIESKYYNFLVWVLNLDDVEATWIKRRPVFKVTSNNTTREISLKEFSGGREDIKISYDIFLQNPVKIEIDVTGENFYVHAEKEDG